MEKFHRQRKTFAKYIKERYVREDWCVSKLKSSAHVVGPKHDARWRTLEVHIWYDALINLIIQMCVVRIKKID